MWCRTADSSLYIHYLSVPGLSIPPPIDAQELRSYKLWCFQNAHFEINLQPIVEWLLKIDY